MVVSEIVTLLIYAISMVFLQEYFGAPLPLPSSPLFRTYCQGLIR